MSRAAPTARVDPTPPGPRPAPAVFDLARALAQLLADEDEAEARPAEGR